MLIRVYRLDMLLHKICNHYSQHDFNLKHFFSHHFPHISYQRSWSGLIWGVYVGEGVVELILCIDKFYFV